MTDEADHLDVIAQFDRDRVLAHDRLFRHRHPEVSADAHAEMIRAIYSPYARVAIEGFRGLSKSTRLEEAAVVRACYREFHYMVIVRSSYAWACLSLAAIKREFEVNDYVRDLYHIGIGPIWQEGKIVLSNGLCIQALGRDQSIVGLRYLDHRPDALLVDDVEEVAEVRSDAERQQSWDWFMMTLLPALDNPVTTWARVLGTRRGSGSLPERCEKAGWMTRKFPIEYIDEEGRRAATWPGKFPLTAVDALLEMYRGDMHTYMQEFMCQSTSETARVFARSDLRCEPRVRPPWAAVYAMYDPARTATRTSATTGRAVWSWFGSRLHFWRLDPHLWLPDQIISDLFETWGQFQPVWLGFEEDGLNEWALQAIRAEMVRRRQVLPLLPVRAPRNKSAFIGGLQPFCRAGEVTFDGPESDFREAIDQFLSFPRGRIDAPNAAAYALSLRPGSPVYDGFGEEHIAETLEVVAGKPLYLAGNSDGSVVAAALVQRDGGQIRVLADWVREGRPDEVAGEIHAEAALFAETGVVERRTVYGEGADLYKMPAEVERYRRFPLRWIVPSWHRESYRNVGLIQAVRAIPQQISPAGADGAGRGIAIIAGQLATRQRGQPNYIVSSLAGWTLRAMAGGYAKPLGARGLPGIQPDSGIYQVLMEAIESFAAVGTEADAALGDDGQPVAYDRRGVAYRSVIPAREGRA